jgi:hypothetical protein
MAGLPKVFGPPCIGIDHERHEISERIVGDFLARAPERLCLLSPAETSQAFRIAVDLSEKARRCDFISRT